MAVSGSVLTAAVWHPVSECAVVLWENEEEQHNNGRSVAPSEDGELGCHQHWTDCTSDTTWERRGGRRRKVIDLRVVEGD